MLSVLSRTRTTMGHMKKTQCDITYLQVHEAGRSYIVFLSHTIILIISEESGRNSKLFSSWRKLKIMVTLSS